MDDTAIVIQRPVGAVAQLVLLFHGYGTNARDLLPLGARIAKTFPQALVVSVNAPQPSGYPGGYQWFSVAGIDEDSRQARVDASMPSFVECVQHWQQQAGLDAKGTALVGFSQGAIMALESTKLPRAIASRVVAIAGRFATLPELPGYEGTIHFLHGKEDDVIHYQYTIEAAHYLRDHGVDITAEVLPFVGHDIPAEFAGLTATKLSSHISHRLWTQALQSAQTGEK